MMQWKKLVSHMSHMNFIGAAFDSSIEREMKERSKGTENANNTRIINYFPVMQKLQFHYTTFKTKFATLHDVSFG